MQFVRAPDENVFIAPFNLLEMFLLILPLEWWVPRKRYQRINDYVMGVIYSPLLLVTAAFETRQAHVVKTNRRRGEADDDTHEEWDVLYGEMGRGLRVSLASVLSTCSDSIDLSLTSA